MCISARPAATDGRPASLVGDGVYNQRFRPSYDHDCHILHCIGCDTRTGDEGRRDTLETKGGGFGSSTLGLK